MSRTSRISSLQIRRTRDSRTFCRRSSKNCRRRRSFSASPEAEGRPSADTATRRWRREWLPMGKPGIAAVWRRRQKGQGHQMVSLPLLTPQTFLCAATPFGRAAKRGIRGLGSVRRADFETLLCPEFTLRYSPRMTVRGHPVQGGSVPLRKAPLRSRVCSWSSKRPCGPLTFRRATEGSRVQRKMRGS